MVTFRKSKKVGPFRLTLSPRGVSTSAGVPGFRMSANSKGEVRRTVSVPGTGVYDTKKVNGRRKPGGPSRAEIDQQLDGIATELVLGLEPEDQRKAYDMFRADPDRAMLQVRHDLGAAGMDDEGLDLLMPALRRYMDRWMAL